MKHTHTKNLRAEYDLLEDTNNHTEAAKLLVDQFGTEDEKQIMEDIAYRHKKNGHIVSEDYKKRYEVSQKYYHLLKAIS
jgi:hypothetical protein